MSFYKLHLTYNYGVVSCTISHILLCGESFTNHSASSSSSSQSSDLFVDRHRTNMRNCNTNINSFCGKQVFLRLNGLQCLWFVRYFLSVEFFSENCSLILLF